MRAFLGSILALGIAKECAMSLGHACLATQQLRNVPVSTGADV
jgi:hypothetical protein